MLAQGDDDCVKLVEIDQDALHELQIERNMFRSDAAAKEVKIGHLTQQVEILRNKVAQLQRHLDMCLN